MAGARLQVALRIFDATGHADRPLDGRWIATDPPAPVIENAVQAPVVARWPESVPHVGVLGHQAQRHLLAGAADQYGKLALRRRVELFQARLDPRQGLLQVAQAATHGAELVAILAIVALEPAGADPQDEAAAAQLIDGARHVRQQVWVPIAVAGDHHTELRMLGVDRDRRQQGQALEMPAIAGARQRKEVIPGPDAIHAELVEPLPGVPNLLDGRVLRVQLDAHFETRHRAYVIGFEVAKH